MPDRHLPQRLFDTALFISVPVVVHTMGAIHWLLDPFHVRDRTLNHLLPELKRFPSATMRRLAIYTARTNDPGLAQFVFFALVAVIVSASILVGTRFIRTADVNRLTAGLGWVVLVYLAFSAICWLEVARARILLPSTRKTLRQKLTRLGLPTCVACGYNLKGNTTGICPECGSAAK